ncbi:MAG: tRNA-dihydrouridine synthase, partial [Coriobacteriales bacterium]|nr:tRNA-dihydrouridine synthase [Coriobacteriales bacterium]
DATLKFCEILFDAGASNICIHGRSKAQLYHGKANWDVIKLASEQFGREKISGSGDIFSYEDAKQMSKYCNVSRVYAARGAMKNPYIFSNTEPTKFQRLNLALKHLDFHQELISNEYYNNLRTNMVSYLHSFNGAKELRVKFMRARTYEDYKCAILEQM